MSNLVSPRTISLSKQPSLRDETKSAKSEISLAPKSPTKKLLLIGSRDNLDSVHLSPKKIAATPIVWPSQPPQQQIDKSIASSLNTNRETEVVSLKKNQVSRKKKGKSTLEDRKESAPQLQTLTLNKKYVDDYSSLLMCFPERIDSLSADKKTPHDFFNPFSDLVRSTMNKHDGRLLENILEEDLIIRSAREGGDRNVDKRDLMKKVLEFNKIQKYHYIKQTAAEKKNILLPLIKQVKEKHKHIPPVKVLPSRRLWEDNAPVEVVQNNNNATTTAQSPQQGSLASKRGISNPSVSANTLALNTSASQTSVNHSKKVSQNLKAYEEKIDIGIPLYAFKAMRVFWAYNSTNDTTWKPETREGHTFTTVGKVIVLYGGLSAALLEEVTIYDPTKGLWERPRVTGDIPLSGRHGHTACEYKKSMIIFGGEHQFNPTLSIRECLNDTRLFIPEKNEWKHMRTHNQINPRRHHAAAIHDHLMWVYGGINNEGKFMKDLWALNLRNYTWEKVEAPGDKESGIAFQTLTSCYVDRSSYANKDKRTYEEGLYVFGGKNSEGKILGTLKVCSAEGKVYQWSYPITKGNPPTPRYNHTTLFYEPLGLLVVYGGRNDSLYESMNDICLNDIRILNLEQMVWIQTTNFGDVPKVGRYRHGAAAFGTKMLIFGGVEFQKYANEEVKSVEIHQSKVKNIIHMDPEGDGSGDRSKSRNESLPPILKDAKKTKRDHILMSHQASIQPKAILSYLPIPIQRPFGDDEDTAPRSFSNLSPLPMDRSTENMSRTGQL